jgi:hypothetical protein
METLTIPRKRDIALRAAVQIIIVTGIIMGGFLIKYFLI